MRYFISILIILAFMISNTSGNTETYQESDSLLSIIKLNKKDTNLVNAYYELSWSIRKSFPDSANTLAHEGIEIANKISYLKGEANLYKCIGSINWNSGLYSTANEAYNTALELFTKMSIADNNNLSNQGKIGISNCNNGLGLVAFHQGNYQQAIEYFQKALDISAELNNKNGVANAYNNIGLVHWKQDNHNRAIEYYALALNIFKELDSKSGMSSCYNNIAIILKTQEKYDQALENYKKSLQIEFDQNNKKGIAAAYNNIGMLYAEINDYHLAHEYYTKALQLKEEINDKNGISSTLNNLADLNNILAGLSADSNEKQQKYKQAINYALKSLTTAKEIGALFRQLEAYQYLSESYEGLNNPETALNYYLNYIEIKDSLFNKEKNEQIEEAEAKFQTVKKQQEIDQQKEELEKQTLFRNLLLTLSFLIILLILLLYNRYYLKQKTNKLLEEKNKELEKLSIVASKTDNAITIYNANLEIEWINAGFSKLFGYSLNEFKEKYSNKLINISSNPTIEKIIRQVEKEKKSTTYESTLITKNGERIYLQTTLTPILNKKNQIYQFIVIDTDITELKKAESEIIQKNEEILLQNKEIEKHRFHLEQLVDQRTKDLKIAKEKAEESDRLKSSFLANMSHEIRTPMNAIIGYSSLLNDKSIETDIKKNLIAEISVNSYSLLNIIDNILDLSRIDSNQFTIQKKKFSINELLKNIYDSFQDVIKQKHLKFELQIPKESIEIVSDEFRLKQVFNNLIDNSIKFTEDGKIAIGYKANTSSIDFFVQDTGIGLSEEQQNHIFNRFTKIEDDKRKLYRGAGLGLAVSKNIINLLNGEIWIESKLSEGASFYFSIPFHKEEMTNKTEPQSKVNSEIHTSFTWENKTILIAEDEDNNFNYFKMLINNTKAKVIRASNGKEAVEFCKKEIIHLVLMDVKMPIMNGFEATKIIKQSNPEIPVISISAYSSKEDMEFSSSAGCVVHLTKPIQKTELLNAMNKQLI